MCMEIINITVNIISFFANLLTIFASAIAIYLFLFRGAEFQAAFKLILSWSFQVTLSDLKNKLERLNDYTVNEPTHIQEIRSILYEIAGQIRGNPKLNKIIPDFAFRLDNIASSRQLTEPKKRALISELRETIRNIEINSITTSAGEKNV